MDHSGPAFEIADLLNAVEGDADVARLVAEQFLAEGERLPQRLDEALTADDTAAAARLAHEIRGMAGSLGASRLARCAGAVEAALRDDPRPGPSGAAALHAEWRAVADGLARFVGRR
jgi:HPt (histidine-containing phosphotransfer) domain-containing protein